MNIVDLVNMDVGYGTVFNRKKTTVMDKLSLNLSKFLVKEYRPTTNLVG